MGRVLLTLVVALAAPLAASASEAGVELDSLRLSLVESFPLQVMMSLAGSLEGECPRLDGVEQRFEPGTRRYEIELVVSASETRDCARDDADFDLTLPIVKAGLAAGVFTVASHGHSVSFEIEPLGDFPGLDLPSAGAKTWFCAPSSRLCFSPPAGWRRSGLEWLSPPGLSARLGLRSRPLGGRGPEETLPAAASIRAEYRARLSWGSGRRFLTWLGDDRFSEHVVARCGESWCELWLEAPSEPLLEAAGESFWQVVRFAVRY